MNEIGFTGTQEGMNVVQHNLVRIFLEILRDDIPEETVFHHGDCIGADEEAHEIAFDLGYTICLHPPANPYKRAFCTAPAGRLIVRDPLPYMERNDAIVAEGQIILGTPKEEAEVLRSGTWATIRRAHAKAVVLYPSGRVEKR